MDMSCLQQYDQMYLLHYVLPHLVCVYSLLVVLVENITFDREVLPQKYLYKKY